MKTAFPLDSVFPNEFSESEGINVRTYIATHALAGMLAAPGNPALGATPEEQTLTIGQLVAKRCVQYADALISELNKTDS